MLNRSVLLSILYFLFFCLQPAISQEIEFESDSTAYFRAKWFLSQRSAPGDSIPLNAMHDALQQKVTMGPNSYYLSNPWGTIGPAPLIYYDNQNSGRITTLRYYSSNGLYIGGANGGVIQVNGTGNPSTATWTDRSQGLLSLSSGAIGVDMQSNPPRIYYGSGESVTGFIYSYLGQGLFISSDGGQTWVQKYTNEGLPVDAKFYRIAVRPGIGHNNEILAATNKGLFRSANSGASWSVVSGTENKVCNDVAFSYQDDSKVFIHRSRRVTFQVEDEGKDSAA